MKKALRHKQEYEFSLDEETHEYSDHLGSKNYNSVSKFWGRFKSFDDNKKSLEMANGDPVRQQQILKEWNEKKNISTSFGTRFHKAMEMYSTYKVIADSDKDIEELIYNTEKVFSGYSRTWMEFIVGDVENKICGTIDRPCVLNEYRNIFSIGDYKTNLSRGIEFINRFGSFKKAPLEFMMDCNYNDYVLQLNTYARILTKNYLYNDKPIKIGDLFIVDVSNLRFPIKIPIPYMPWVIDHMFRKHNIS